MPFDAQCATQTKGGRIVVSENRSSATFVNPSRHSVTTIRVDGCMLKNTIAADYVVVGPEQFAIIVELKGVDVSHAVDQISATARFWKLQCPEHARLAALIVCARYPRIDTKVQRVKQQLRRELNIKLRVESRNKEFRFDEFR
jgi:hypothetical protein